MRLRLDRAACDDSRPLRSLARRDRRVAIEAAREERRRLLGATGAEVGGEEGVLDTARIGIEGR